MKTTNDNRAELRELGALAPLLRWMDRHPRAASLILWLQVAALLWAVFTYRFTIPAYQ